MTTAYDHDAIPCHRCHDVIEPGEPITYGIEYNDDAYHPKCYLAATETTWEEE